MPAGWIQSESFPQFVEGNLIHCFLNLLSVFRRSVLLWYSSPYKMERKAFVILSIHHVMKILEGLCVAPQSLSLASRPR